jgi:hypothetical protein
MVCPFFRRIDGRDTFGELLCVVLALALFLGAGSPVIAQKNSSLPAKEEGKTLVERSNKLTNLRALGSAAFHISVRAKSYRPKGQTIQGIYDLWWATPDRWREEISWGDKSFVRIADKNRLWVNGADANRLDTLHVTRLLDFPSRLRIPPDLSVDRVQARQTDGVPAICMRLFHFSPPSSTISIPGTGLLTVSPPDVERSACWDAGSRL